MPQRLQDITAPNSDHFQHVGQQSFMTTAHSHQPDATGRAPSVDGAETVTGSAQIGAVRQAAWGDDDPPVRTGATTAAMRTPERGSQVTVSSPLARAAQMTRKAWDRTAGASDNGFRASHP